MAEEKIVWILGAGFSQSLGAPLLADLFTPESVARVQDKYSGGGDRVKHFDDVAALYRAGAYDLKDGHKPELRLWAHAEEFLERLDLADKGTTDYTVLTNLAVTVGRNGSTPRPFLENIREGDNLEVLRTQAVRLLAAEVCVFLKSANLASERWRSYVQWANNLTGSDTILTFNYDLVPDRLQEDFPKNVRVALPRDIDDVRREAKGAESGMYPVRGALVLKLHGSVDWYLREKAGGKPREMVVDRAVKGDKDAAVFSDSKHLALATPGPRKLSMVEHSDDTRPEGPLYKLWEEARLRVIKAHRVIFLGYSIPPTDAHSRDDLFKWIKAAQNPHISIVLGADRNAPYAQRLKGIMDMATNPSRVNVVPMFAEDFLGCFQPR